MRVYVIRHAIAAERNRRRWPDDAERPLTAHGERKFRRLARELGKVVGRVDRLYTSPLRRTRQTAALLRRAGGWPKAREAPVLAPGGGAAQVLALVKRERCKRIALVGHEPDLTALLAHMLAGPRAQFSGALEKGAVACLNFEGRVRAGAAHLEWLLTPRLARKLRRAR